jgi:hypothetical protein
MVVVKGRQKRKSAKAADRLETQKISGPSGLPFAPIPISSPSSASSQGHRVSSAPC